jgi:hypothetical protein
MKKLIITGNNRYRQNRELHPDMIMDFRKLDFKRGKV